MKIKFYLKRPKSKTETTIYILVNYNGNSLKIYTGESILPKHWNSKANTARASLREAPEFNERLNKIRSSINRVFLDYKNKHENANPSPAILKPLIDIALKRGEEKTTLLSYFEDFVTRSLNGQRFDPKGKKAIRFGVGKGYRTTLNHLIEFDKQWKRKLDFETVDLDFHADFTKYLSSPPISLSANTIGDQFKRLKAVLAEATERGVNTTMAFKSKYFIKQSEEADTIYLNENELSQVRKLNLKDNPRLDNVRDLLLIGCYTGLRISDLLALKQKNINDGFIRIKQIKTSDPVTIPVHPVVKEILAKYQGGTPRPISKVKMNLYLKELGQMVELLKQPVIKTFTKGGEKQEVEKKKWQLLTSHAMRRSFATNEYKKGVLTTLEIMALTGHSTETSFLKYIKVTPEEHAISAKKKWEKKENKLRIA